MQLIIAPAKKMRVDPDSFPVLSQPAFLLQTQAILAVLKQLSKSDAQTLWRTSEKLTDTSFAALQALDLAGPLTPAVLAYVGIQYQSLAADILTQEALDYLQGHLRIVSGFYGLLRPFDGIVPYRLEMQAQLAVGGAQNLYDYWGQRLHDALDFDHGPLLNLASLEYSKAITAHLLSGEQVVDVVFGRLVDGRVKVAATPAKIARGSMVRWLALHQMTDVAAVREFADPNWQFDAERSTPTQLVFLEREPGRTNR